MGFKMKGWKAYDTTDHSNNTPDGRAGSSAFQQGAKEAFQQGAKEGLSERLSQKGLHGGKHITQKTKSKITGPTKTTGPSKITRSKTFNPKLKPIKRGKDLWEKMDKNLPSRVFGDEKVKYGGKEKSPLKKTEELKFTPGNVLRVLRDEYKRAFGKGWRKKFKKKK